MSAFFTHWRSVSPFTPSSAAMRETGRSDERTIATASARNSSGYLYVPTWDLSFPWTTHDPVSEMPTIKGEGPGSSRGTTLIVLSHSKLWLSA